MLVSNMKTTDSVEGRIDVYHTHAMRRDPMRTNGRICGVKPVFLRKVYKRLMGNASASRTTGEAAVNTCVHLLPD